MLVANTGVLVEGGIVHILTESIVDGVTPIASWLRDRMSTVRIY